MQKLEDVNDQYKKLKDKITNGEVRLHSYLDVVSKAMEVAEETGLPGSDKKDLVLELLEQVNVEYLKDYIDDSALKVMFTAEMLSDTIDIIKFIANGKTLLTEKRNKWKGVLTCCSAKK